MSQTVYLAHHGIKGMKWGVRRFQNKDGSLTPAGRKRVSARYEQLMNRFERDQDREWTSRYVDSHNRAADDVNRKSDKLGKNADDDDMIEYYEKQLDKYMNESLSELYSSNKNLQQARALAKKYDMVKWDDLAKSHEKGLKDFENRTGNKVKRTDVDVIDPTKRNMKRLQKESQRQYGRLEDARIYKANPKHRDFDKAYGRLEDTISYNKFGNKEVNDIVLSTIKDMDAHYRKHKTYNGYDVNKLNNAIDKSMRLLDDDAWG